MKNKKSVKQLAAVKMHNKEKSFKKRGDKIQRQSKELKIKNGLLKNGAAKQIKSNEQIRILTKALDSTDEGIFIIDIRKAGYPVIYANRAFRQMAGHSKKEILSLYQN